MGLSFKQCLLCHLVCKRNYLLRLTCVTKGSSVSFLNVLSYCDDCAITKLLAMHLKWLSTDLTTDALCIEDFQYNICTRTEGTNFIFLMYKLKKGKATNWCK